MTVSRAETPPGHVLRNVGRNGIPEISLARARVPRNMHSLLIIACQDFRSRHISSYQATGIFLVLEHRERSIAVQRRNNKDSMSFKNFSQCRLMGSHPKRLLQVTEMLSHLTALPVAHIRGIKTLITSKSCLIVSQSSL